MTLLEIVQNILSAMDSDEVNSIFDTTESLQVAEVVRETFYEQFNNIEIPELRTVIRLTSVSDPVDRPNYLKLPVNVKKIEWVKYRNARNNDNYETVKFLSPEDFFQRVLDMRSSGPNTRLVTDPSGVSFYIQNNRTPQFYTSMDDEYLIFDAFDEEAEASMQAARSFSWGTLDQQFALEDTYIAPIDSNLFPLLLAEAKDTCFINFRQISNSKEQVKARRQRIRMQNDQYRDRQAQYKAQKEWDYSRKRP
jgi:hypothetical protein